MDWIFELSLIIGVVLFAILLYFSMVFLIEKEIRASVIAFLFAFLFLALFFSPVYLPEEYKTVLSAVLVFTFTFGVVLLILPINNYKKIKFEIPATKHDERDVMFSRNELMPGTDLYDEYYSRNPDIKKLDDKFRDNPGLLSSKASQYEPYSFSASKANSELMNLLKYDVNSPDREYKQPVDQIKISKFLKKWAKLLGAEELGITHLKDYHLYSHKGRGALYNEEIKNNHTYALAITVKMDEDFMLTAPKGPVIMESTQRYLDVGIIALQITKFIGYLGYSARAHIDGNYEVICPLVARDTGLGEIGRMGLLMTPGQGPRVRIAIITTNLPLVLDKPKDYRSLIDFCNICKKCAHICPSASISFDKRKNIDGVMRWNINSESCFTYWSKIGTDCGKCMAFCPYSHPDNFMHNLIRRGIRNSMIFRRFALFMDDLFYKKKPVSRKLPDWIEQ